jgi:hypothetical protein
LGYPSRDNLMAQANATAIVTSSIAYYGRLPNGAGISSRYNQSPSRSL